MEVDDAGAEAIAARSRGTPRVANRLLKRVRDFAEVRGAGSIDAAVAREALDLLEVDAAGLDRLDREILRAICEKFGGGPVGLSTLAVAVGEEPDTIEDVYEPYLLQQGFLMRTPRGRVATDAAFAHSGLERPGRPASGSSRSLTTLPPHAALSAYPATSMPNFICPNCGDRSISTERTAGFQNRARACRKCGFGFLFELLDDYYPAPNAAFFLLDQQGRLIGAGPGRARADRASATST